MRGIGSSRLGDLSGRRRRITNDMSKALVPFLLLLLLPAGCGGGSSSGSDGSTQLHITVWPHGKSGTSSSYTLNCPEGTGTLPDARAACSKLKRVDAAVFAPVPSGTACTEIYGGPQTALVVGRLAGKPLRAALRAEFSRTNGCEMARWGRLVFLFPVGS
jgi:hypothetical protein